MLNLLLSVIALAATLSVSSGQICSYAPPTIYSPPSAPPIYKHPENNPTNALSDADLSFWEINNDGEKNSFIVNLGCTTPLGKIILRNSFGLTGTG